jgi:hypothetical protein
MGGLGLGFEGNGSGPVLSQIYRRGAWRWIGVWTAQMSFRGWSRGRAILQSDWLQGLDGFFKILLLLELGILLSTYQKYVEKMEHPNFRKHYTIFYAQFTSCLHGKSFIATTEKRQNICRFSWKRVKFELQVLHSLLMFFYKNHF